MKYKNKYLPLLINILKVTELVLDDLFAKMENLTEDHKKALEKYDSITLLSFNGFGLKNLKNFPKLTTLTTVW